MISYASLADVRAAQSAQMRTEDAILLAYARAVSRRVDREMFSKRPLFSPYIEARKVYVASTAVNSFNNTLMLDGPLLELTGVTVGGSTIAVGTVVNGYPDVDNPPFWLLNLESCTSWYTSAYCGTFPPLATITGVWGLHTDYNNAWATVFTLSANVTDSATTFDVLPLDGDQDFLIYPGISAGNLIKLDSEYMEVTATSDNTITVKRAAHGSTAAAHLAGVAVATWQVEDEIRQAVARTAALFYARRGAYNQQSVGDATAQFPNDLLVELRGALQGYAYGA